MKKIFEDLMLKIFGPRITPIERKKLYTVKFTSFVDKINNNQSIKILAILSIISTGFFLYLNELFVLPLLMFVNFTIYSFVIHIKKTNKIVLCEDGFITEIPGKSFIIYDFIEYEKIKYFRINKSIIRINLGSFFKNKIIRGFTKEDISKIKDILTQKGIKQEN